jgi:hypothetical protein
MKYVKASKIPKANKPFVRNRTSYRWIENATASGFRVVGYADKLTTLRHTGWYTDEHSNSETYRGVVLQLPARKGKRVIVSGYADPINNDCYLIENTVTECSATDDDDIRDAAMTADSIAQSFAEECVEHDIAYNRLSAAKHGVESDRESFREHIELLRILRQAEPDRQSVFRHGYNQSTAACWRAYRQAVRELHRAVVYARDYNLTLADVY